MEPHFEHGAETSYFMGAEHEIVYFYVGIEKIPEDSPEGQELMELGLHVNEDAWAKFV